VAHVHGGARVLVQRARRGDECTGKGFSCRAFEPRGSPGRNVPARAASEPHGLGTTTTNKRERSNHRRHREAAVAPAGHRAGSDAGPVWSWGHSRSSRLHCRRPRREPARCRVLPLRTLARPSLDLRCRRQRRHMQPARAAIQRSKKYNISSSHPLYVIGCVGERVTIGSGSQRSATEVQQCLQRVVHAPPSMSHTKLTSRRHHSWIE
jgi:hypothetical protein